MTDRNESYGNPSANHLMQRVWDAEHPPKGSMTTGDPRITVHTSPVSHVCKALRAVIEERDALRACVAELEAERDALLRDCWEACGGKGPDSSDDELVGTIDTMRVGIERLQAQLDAGTEAGWHALRSERDALRARIKDAPSVLATAGAWDVAPDSAFLSAKLPRNYAGKRVALVALGDDE